MLFEKLHKHGITDRCGVQIEDLCRYWMLVINQHSFALSVGRHKIVLAWALLSDDRTKG